ncbi:exopolysaccharide biosynthesis protein [Nostocaceae cyanobacterium CENA357]|uniref:Exopolysaccharide biosynthesis protein n=1 Tax=Atlanticothrix silvestris CENA357 TaxID=1725252 RepID=A0A8J7HCI5_9CYAN|nr:tyrosine-protein kinase domain-containing protein [Atlanticothrix silvestris]MBH8552824.1 exopolysaccharide biosynthesis protein [Atlanticothrix silvestris CENA357]
MKISAILQRYWLPLVVLHTITLGGAFSIAMLSPRTWTANTQLILPDTTNSLDASLGILGQIKDQGVAFTNELNPLQVQTSIITSDDVIRPVWLTDPERDKFRSLGIYKKLFKVKPVDQSTTISLEVTGSLPELTIKRSERLLLSYQRRLNELRQGTSDTRQQFSQMQLQKAEHDLRLAKEKLGQFKTSTGLINDEQQTRNLIEAIKGLRTIETDVGSQAKAARTRSQILSQRLEMTPQQAINSLRLSQNKEYQALRQKLSEVDTELAFQKGDLTEQHPRVQSLQEKQYSLNAALNQQLNSLLPNTEGIDTSFGGNNFQEATMNLIVDLIQADSDSQALEQQAKQIQSQVQSLNAELSSISTKQGEFLDLQRQYEIAEGIYKGIVAQLEQAKISAFSSYPNVQILDSPTVDPKPTSPKLSLVALGAILSSILGSFATVTYLESRNSLLKVKDLQEIELPILARIPTLEASTMGLKLESVSEIGFQRLASTLSLMSLENRRLMVSSSISGEGKTTVTIGLATALSVLGFRVLVVDGDFHKTKLSKYFGYTLPRETNTLPSPIPVSSKLDFLPAPSIPTGKVMEFVARGKFEEYMNRSQKLGNYDYVIVDTAAVNSTGETPLMAKTLANVLLVVKLGVSDRHMLQESLEQLVRHNAQIIGFALNGVEQGGEKYVYKQDVQQVRA